MVFFRSQDVNLEAFSEWMATHTTDDWDPQKVGKFRFREIPENFRNIQVGEIL